jgi:hypothetical protein
MCIGLAVETALRHWEKLLAVEIDIVATVILGLWRHHLLRSIRLVVLGLGTLSATAGHVAAPERHHLCVINISSGGHFISLDLVVDSLMDAL